MSKLPDGNPLGFEGLFPPFGEIKAEHVKPGITALLEESKTRPLHKGQAATAAAT